MDQLVLESRFLELPGGCLNRPSFRRRKVRLYGVIDGSGSGGDAGAAVHLPHDPSDRTSVL